MRKAKNFGKLVFDDTRPEVLTYSLRDLVRRVLDPVVYGILDHCCQFKSTGFLILIICIE